MCRCGWCPIRVVSMPTTPSILSRGLTPNLPARPASSRRVYRPVPRPPPRSGRSGHLDEVVGRAIAGWRAVDENRPAVGVLGAQRKDLLVGGRAVPRPCALEVGEFDD